MEKTWQKIITRPNAPSKPSTIVWRVLLSISHSAYHIPPDDEYPGKYARLVLQTEIMQVDEMGDGCPPYSL